MNFLIKALFLFFICNVSLQVKAQNTPELKTLTDSLVNDNVFREHTRLILGFENPTIKYIEGKNNDEYKEISRRERCTEQIRASEQRESMKGQLEMNRRKGAELLQEVYRKYPSLLQMNPLEVSEIFEEGYMRIMREEKPTLYKVRNRGTGAS